MNLDQIISHLREQAMGGTIAESEESSLLHLTRDEFMTKMLKEENGQELLNIMEIGEHRICERLGLCNGYRKDKIIYIDVPGWNNLVSHLQCVFYVEKNGDTTND